MKTKQKVEKFHLRPFIHVGCLARLQLTGQHHCPKCWPVTYSFHVPESWIPPLLRDKPMTEHLWFDKILPRLTATQREQVKEEYAKLQEHERQMMRIDVNPQNPLRNAC